jgi:hypothetical protein
MQHSIYATRLGGSIHAAQTLTEKSSTLKNVCFAAWYDTIVGTALYCTLPASVGNWKLLTGFARLQAVSYRCLLTRIASFSPIGSIDSTRMRTLFTVVFMSCRSHFCVYTNRNRRRASLECLVGIRLLKQIVPVLN